MAGNLAMVHRVFMGMSFELDGLHLNPVIPEAYGGTRTLKNFNYRNAQLDITIHGHGTEISMVRIDGKEIEDAFIPADWTGPHTIEITMAGNAFPQQSITEVDNHFTLPTVQAFKDNSFIKWQAVDGVQEYRVYKNGVLSFSHPKVNNLDVNTRSHVSHMVTAVDAQGYEGFASEPVVFSNNEQIIQLEQHAPSSDKNYSNYSGDGFIEVSLERNRTIEIPITISEPGDYAIDFRYSNGNGRWNTNNKCAIRSLSVDDQYTGVVVFPQRGLDEWSEWGYSNARVVSLAAGTHRVRIHFEDWNHNMNVDVNTAMLDHMRLIKIQ